MQEVEVRVWEVSKYFEFVMPNQLNLCECQKILNSKIFTAKKNLVLTKKNHLADWKSMNLTQAGEAGLSSCVSVYLNIQRSVVIQ